MTDKSSDTLGESDFVLVFADTFAVFHADHAAIIEIIENVAFCSDKVFKNSTKRLTCSKLLSSLESHDL